MTNKIENTGWETFLPKIQAESVDLILTDPPYAIASKKTSFTRTKDPRYSKIHHDFGAWDYAEVNLPALTEQFWRVLRPGGTAIIFYDVWKITPLKEALAKAGKGFSKLRLIIWEKTNPVPKNSDVTYLSNAREIAVLGIKGENAVFNSKFDKGVYHVPTIVGGKNRKEKRFHSTQKPEALFKALIEKHSKPGETVLDAFMGSGTTAACALMTGRKFLGCEIDEEYCKKANTRIEGLQKTQQQEADIFEEE